VGIMGLINYPHRITGLAQFGDELGYELSITIPKMFTFVLFKIMLLLYLTEVTLLKVDSVTNGTCLVLLKFKVNRFELSQSSTVKEVLTPSLYCILLQPLTTRLVSPANKTVLTELLKNCRKIIYVGKKKKLTNDGSLCA
jgi:hypothetical protein